jgi:hypothetical protein
MVSSAAQAAEPSDPRHSWPVIIEPRGDLSEVCAKKTRTSMFRKSPGGRERRSGAVEKCDNE